MVGICAVLAAVFIGFLVWAVVMARKSKIPKRHDKAPPGNVFEEDEE
jgi:hypothetical protein